MVPPPPSMPPSGFLQAYLLVEDGTVLTCWFNPTTLNVTRTAKWENANTLDGKEAPLKYVGGQEQALSLRLLFHAEGQRTGAQVKLAIEALYGLLEPKDQTAGNLAHPRPQTVQFIWGSYRSDPAVVTSVEVATELFDVDGTALRAWATLSLSRSLSGQEQARNKPTNPTTKATHRRRGHEVAPGEDLALIAHRHYRDPTRWREIAEENGLDDPLRVRAPDLLIVPLEDV